jgi:hypothetical protein
MPVTENTYEQVALEDPEGQWELVCGRLRTQPGMTQDHNDIVSLLTFFLQMQLPRRLRFPRRQPVRLASL